MRHVSQHGAFRPDPRDPVEREREMRVGRMLAVTEAVDDPEPHASQRREGFLRQRLDVGRVSHIADPVSRRRDPAVPLRKRHDREPVMRERFRHHDGVEAGLRPLPARRLENVTEAAPDHRKRAARTVDIECPRHVVVDGPEVVDPVYVVGVAVGIEHGVDTRDARVHELPMEVGRRVDEKTGSIRFDQDGNPAAAVSRVVRPAYRAGTTDHRDAARRAAAENRYSHVL